uniref:Uncharacterized protein n=1 Tax=Anguilla anguilla TaxID=7936 RepID=A0A0E9PZ30_ANGAN
MFNCTGRGVSGYLWTLPSFRVWGGALTDPFYPVK